MATMETIVCKAGKLGKGDVIVDGSTARLIEDYELKDFATTRVFHTVVIKRILGFQVKTARKTIRVASDAVFTVWHNMLLEGNDIMLGDKVYHMGQLVAVKKINRSNPHKVILSTIAGRIKVSKRALISVSV